MVEGVPAVARSGAVAAEEGVRQVEVVVGERIFAGLTVMGAVVGVSQPQGVGRTRLPHQRADDRDTVGVGNRGTAYKQCIENIAVAVEVDAGRTGNTLR